MGLHELLSSDIESIRSGFSPELFDGKRVLVTGGAGFIGSWMCDILLSLNSKVTCVDNLFTGMMKNISHVRGVKGFRFINMDLTKRVPRSRYDLILHLASRPSPDDYVRHPVETLLINTDGTRRALDLARRCDATFLLASTSEIYGDPDTFPTPETEQGRVNTIGSRSCYHEGKRVGESLAVAYRREYGMNIRIVRIFNTYGPRLRADGYYGRALSRFLLQALTGQNITVYGNGKQTRSFCYISDTIDGMLRTLIDPRGNGDVFNIGNPQEIRILDLAKKIVKTTGSKSKISFLPLPDDDPLRRVPDISKARRILGFKPRISLNDGLQKTLVWFQTAYKRKIHQ